MGIFNWLSGQKADVQASAAEVYAKITQLVGLQSNLQGLTAAKQIALNMLVPQLSALRLGVYNRSTGLREKNYLHDKLNYDICSYLTGYEFWEAVFYNLLRYNNAFARKIKAGDKVIGLRPLPTVGVAVVVDDNGYINYSHMGQTYAAADIWHLRLNSADGLLGRAYEVETTAFELAADCERMAKDFFTNGGNVKNIWKFGQATLSPDQLKACQLMLDAAIKGQARQQMDVVVPFGLDRESVQGDLEAAQMLQTREHQAKVILALYGIDLENVNLETIYSLTIVPILENVEQSITKYLLTEREQLQYKIKYMVAGRFRGDTAKQYEIANKALSIHSVNEVREWMGSAPKGPEYDAIVNPNTASAGVNEQRQDSATGTATGGETLND